MMREDGDGLMRRYVAERAARAQAAEACDVALQQLTAMARERDSFEEQAGLLGARCEQLEAEMAEWNASSDVFRLKYEGVLEAERLRLESNQNVGVQVHRTGTSAGTQTQEWGVGARVVGASAPGAPLGLMKAEGDGRRSGGGGRRSGMGGERGPPNAMTTRGELPRMNSRGGMGSRGSAYSGASNGSGGSGGPRNAHGRGSGRGRMASAIDRHKGALAAMQKRGNSTANIMLRRRNTHQDAFLGAQEGSAGGFSRSPSPLQSGQTSRGASRGASRASAQSGNSSDYVTAEMHDNFGDGGAGEQYGQYAAASQQQSRRKSSVNAGVRRVSLVESGRSGSRKWGRGNSLARNIGAVIRRASKSHLQGMG